MNSRHRHLTGLIPLAALVLAGCATDSDTAAPAADAPSTLSVTASFAVLQEAAHRVGGDHVTVTGLTPPGAEPHDLELTPKAVAGLQDASLVVYLHGFQPAVDDAVAALPPTAAFDVTDDARMTLTGVDDGHDHGDAEATDPHFWLDPTRLADVATALGERLATTDPENAQEYRSNAATYAAELTALDEEFTAGLAQCASTELVTGHAAFAYLADRYHLHQEAVTGLSPEAEPTAADLAAAAEHVREAGVRTLYAEPLVSPALVETLARETGAEVLVLDPVEGINDASAGTTYGEIMQANLATLRTGQECT